MKRLLALFLAVIMVCTLLPVSAFAADTQTLNIVEKSGSEPVSVDMASDAKGTGWSWSASAKTLTLSGFKGVSIEADTSLKIVLKGANTLTLPADAKFGISVGGSLTINKSSNSATDTLTILQKTAASSSNLIQTGASDKSCTINGGTVTLKNSTVGGRSVGFYCPVSVKNDACMSVSVPYRGVAYTLSTATSGAVSVSTTGSDPYAAAVYGLNASGSGAVLLSAEAPAVAVLNSLKIASTAGKVTLDGYVKGASPESFSIASNKKVQSVDGYYQGMYATDPSGNPGFYLTDSQGKPLASSAYISVSGQPLAIMDSPMFDLTGLKVGTEFTSGIPLLNATRGGAGDYRYSLKSGSTLPAGLSLNSTTGVISGTPTKACEAGSVVIAVKDSKGASGCSTVYVTVDYSSVKAVNEYLTVNGNEFSLKTDQSGIGWEYTAANKTLTLINYNGGPIKCDSDLNIVLDGQSSISLAGPDTSGIKVNGKLTIDKKTASVYDMLTVTQTVTTTSANLIQTGGNGESKACVINGGTVILQTSTSELCGSVGISNWAYVNNDANLTVTAAYRGVGARLNANSTGSVSIASYGRGSGAAAVYALNAAGSGQVQLIAADTASTVYSSLNVSETAGAVILRGLTKVASAPYENIKLAPNKRIQGADEYYLGYYTSTDTAGKGYYVTGADGTPYTAFAIVSEINQPLVLMDSPLFDLKNLKVGTAVSTGMYPLNATRGGAGSYVYSVKYDGSLPAGLSVNSKTGAIIGTPKADCPAGSFVLVVKDNGGAEGCSSAEITVNYGEVKMGKPLTPVITLSNNASSGKPCVKWSTDNNVKQYVIYRATSKTGNYSKYYTTKEGAASYTNTGAAIGKTYYYKVKAIGYDGSETAFSNVKSITCDCARPVVTASNVSSSGKIKLSWSAVTGAKEYVVYRATSVDGTYSKMYTTTKTSYTNTGAVAGKTYYYKVKAVASSTSYANSAYSTVVSRTCDCAKPVVTASNVSSSGKVKLSWSAVTGAEKYEIYRATSKSGTYTKMYTTTKTSYTNSSSVAGKTYYYKVKAIGAVSDANSGYSEIVSRTCDCARPSVNITLKSGHPSLSWAAVDGAAKYEIYRATSKSGTYTKMYTTSKTSYTNSSASAGKTYYYKVKALSSATSYANSAYSSIVSIKAK